MLNVTSHISEVTVTEVTFILVPHTLHVAIGLLPLFTKLLKAKLMTKGTAPGRLGIAIVNVFFDMRVRAHRHSTCVTLHIWQRAGDMQLVIRFPNVYAPIKENRNT